MDVGPPARGRRGPDWVGPVHRWSGTIAFVVSLPVAFHCLWALGFESGDARVLVHSVAGCVFYGAYAAKMLGLRTRSAPRWALPVLGGCVFTLIVVLWLTSALWLFTNPASRRSEGRAMDDGPSRRRVLGAAVGLGVVVVAAGIAGYAVAANSPAADRDADNSGYDQHRHRAARHRHRHAVRRRRRRGDGHTVGGLRRHS